MSTTAGAALAEAGGAIEIPRNATIYRQSEPSDSVYYVERGLVRVDIASADGRQALVALLGPGSFVGECFLDSSVQCRSQASAILETRAICIPKASVERLLREDPAVAAQFTLYLLRRIARAQEDLGDLQLNSVEKRLARALLLIANIRDEAGQQTALAAMNHQTLAELVGTTRPRISHFLGKFRRLGHVTGRAQLKVHSSLSNVLLGSTTGVTMGPPEP